MFGKEIMKNKKKSTLKKVLITFVLILAVLGATIGYSSIKYQRSLTSTVIEKVFRLNKNTDNEKETRKIYSDRLKQGEEKYKVDDSIKFDVSLTSSNFEGMPVYTLNEKSDNGKVMIYIHGGAYTENMTNYHWAMLNKVAKDTNCKIIVPQYPLAPFHTWEKSYDLLTKLYQSVQSDNKTKKVVIAGDSAGGGLALGLAQEFTKENISQPDHLVLLSPWVDVTMSNPQIKDYDKVEPALSAPSLKVCGELWAGNLKTTDPRISPIYGSMEGLKNVTLFVGTREFFYPDIMKAKKAMEEANVHVTTHIGNGQNHVYVVYPTPEGREATKTITEVVKDL